MKKSNPSSLIMAASLLVDGLIVGLYFVLYQYQPLPAPWNDGLLYFIFVLAAGMSASAATLIAFQFHKEDAPRVIWFYFSLGLWAWTAAEFTWMIYGLSMPEVPGITLADAFWVGALGFFSWAFVRQYRLIFASRRRAERLWLLLTTFTSLILAALIATLLHWLDAQSEQSWFETALTIFYPITDLAIALAALRLSHIFGRGLWGRTWWGLLAFAVSDALYSWLTFTGIYANSAEAGNPLSLFVDITYICAYLAVGIGCLSQWLLMRYGRSRPNTTLELEDVEL